MVGVESDWSHVGEVHPADLSGARLELHWAAQAVDTVGRSGPRRTRTVSWAAGSATRHGYSEPSPIPEPYFYVAAYPAPEVGDLPRLEGFGAWHAEGWTGAVMSVGEIVARSPEGQGPAVVSFIENAMSILDRKLTEERE